jgi:quercetin dioxygenase-like cupin family protein
MAIHAHLALLLLLATALLCAQTNPVPAASATKAHAPTPDSKAVPKQPTPTVFQADEGDHWMLLGDKPLIFKVDPLSTGSDALVVGTEEMPPGNKIPTHKHLHEDEVIFVHKGTVRVTLAGREYDAGTGATVFIPHGNWIGVSNVSSEPAMILFFFNKPAFEQCLRAMSSRLGETFTMPAPDKMAAVRTECHEVMKQ